MVQRQRETAEQRTVRIEARRRLAVERFENRIAEAVASAPPLSDDLKRRLRALILGQADLDHAAGRPCRLIGCGCNR